VVNPSNSLSELTPQMKALPQSQSALTRFVSCVSINHKSQDNILSLDAPNVFSLSFKSYDKVKCMQSFQDDFSCKVTVSGDLLSCLSPVSTCSVDSAALPLNPTD
jgi:hypothetical protein